MGSAHARLRKALLHLTGNVGESLKPRRGKDGLDYFTKAKFRASIEIRCEHGLLRQGSKKARGRKAVR